MPAWVARERRTVAFRPLRARRRRGAPATAAPKRAPRRPCRARAARARGTSSAEIRMIRSQLSRHARRPRSPRSAARLRPRLASPPLSARGASARISWGACRKRSAAAGSTRRSAYRRCRLRSCGSSSRRCAERGNVGRRAALAWRRRASRPRKGSRPCRAARRPSIPRARTTPDSLRCLALAFSVKFLHRCSLKHRIYSPFCAAPPRAARVL
jgi:hypothetical protein